MRPVLLAALVISVACILITAQGKLSTENGSMHVNHGRPHGPIRGMMHKVARFLRLPGARRHLVTHDGRPSKECSSIQCLMDSNEALVREIQALKQSSQIAELQGLLDTEMSNTAGLAQSLEELRNKIADLEADIKRQSNGRVAAERERDALEILHREVSKKLSAAESRASRLSEDLATERASRADELAQHAKELLDAAAESAKEVAALNEIVSQKEQEIKLVKETLGAHASSAHALDARVAKAEAATKIVEASLAEALKHASSLEQDLKNTMQRHSDANDASRATANAALAAAKRDLEVAKERASTLESDLEASRVSLGVESELRAKALAELAAAEQGLAGKKVELETLTAQGELAEHTQAELQQAVARLTTEAAAAKAAASAETMATVLPTAAATLLLGLSLAFLAFRRVPVQHVPVQRALQSDSGTQTAAPKVVKTCSSETQSDVVATVCSGVQAVAMTAGAAVQAAVESATTGAMTDPPSLVSFATMTSPREERRALLELQQDAGIACAATGADSDWITPKKQPGRRGVGAKESLFSPDCAPQCRKATPPGSPAGDECDAFVISPTTYRAEPMEADDLPLSVHDDDCMSVSSITSKESDTRSVRSNRSDRTTASKASTRSARSTKAAAGKENADPQSGLLKLGHAGIKGMLGGATLRSAPGVRRGQLSSDVAGASLRKGMYIDNLLSEVSP